MTGFGLGITARTGGRGGGGLRGSRTEPADVRAAEGRLAHSLIAEARHELAQRKGAAGQNRWGSRLPAGPKSLECTSSTSSQPPPGQSAPGGRGVGKGAPRVQDCQRLGFPPPFAPHMAAGPQSAVWYRWMPQKEVSFTWRGGGEGAAALPRRR